MLEIKGLEELINKFKKDLSEFPGTIVWFVRHDEDNAVLEIMLNNLLFRQLKKLSKKKDTLRRIFRMIRTKGLAEEKQKMLEHLGVKMSPAETDLLMDKYKKEYAMYRYGVKVKSQDWDKVVKFTLKSTSVNGMKPSI